MPTEVLSAVNDFILTYVGNNEIPLLEQPQVVIGWQNVVSALPAKSQEYAVLSFLGSVRHGTNVHGRVHAPGDTGLIDTVTRSAEQLVQADFCSARPGRSEEYARTRAEIMEMLHRDRVSIDFYRKYNISSCYADNVVPLAFMNESEQWVARYSVTLHLSIYSMTNVEIESFSDVGLYLENVDVHHPIKR